jgi:hypothetical protein
VDELAGGSEQAVNDTAKIEFTDDPSRSDDSLNRAVYAEKELVLTAVAKDAALAQADAGNYAAAAKILTTQNAVLHAAYATAPRAVQSQIRAETNYLLDFSKQLDGGAYDGSSRKAMQAQSYNTRNAK